MDLIQDHGLNLGLTLLLAVVILTLRYLVARTVVARLQDAEAGYRARKLSFYISVGLFLVALAWIWTRQLANIGAFIGLISAGVAIALSDVLKNTAAWVVILFRRPFKIGDRIEVGTDAGDVIDIGVLRFSLLEIRNWVDADQTTGRILHIPNGIIFTEPLANYTQGFPYIWLEIPVTVTFESDWETTRHMIQQIIEEHAADPTTTGQAADERIAKQYLSLDQDVTPAVYTKVIDFGVTVTGRLLVTARGRREITSRVWQDILRAISREPRVELAYPTTRFFRADLEGSVPMTRSSTAYAYGGKETNAINRTPQGTVSRAESNIKQERR